MLNDQDAAQVGQGIVELLGLPADENGRYATSWGTKTAVGLARCVQRMILEAQGNWGPDDESIEDLMGPVISDEY